MKQQAYGGASKVVGLTDVGGASPLLSQYRFIASAGTKTATVRVYDALGKVMVEETLSVSTTALAATDDALWAGTPGVWNADYAGIEIVVPEATIYAMACDGTPEVTASNGVPLVSGMCLGMVPAAVRARYEATAGAPSAGIPQTLPAVPVAVSTAVLRVLGATSWTGATTNGAKKRKISVTNHSLSLYAYFDLIVVGGTLTSHISSVNHRFALAPGGSLLDIVLPAGYDLCVVRSATSSETVSAREELL